MVGPELRVAIMVVTVENPVSRRCWPISQRREGTLWTSAQAALGVRSWPVRDRSTDTKVCLSVRPVIVPLR